MFAEAMARQDTVMQLPGGPVAEQAAGVEQAVEQADDAIVMRLGQRGQGSGVDGGVEQFRLLFEIPVVGGGKRCLSAGRLANLRPILRL